jgi:uncharacterized membrane-anchored protein
MNRSTRFAILLFTGSIASCFLMTAVPALSQQVGKEASTQSNALFNGIIFALIGGVVGFLSNFALERYKKSKEPIRRISYSSKIRPGIVEIEEDFKEEVSVLYKGNPVKNSSRAFFDLKNTGNKQIKNLEIRFEFTEGSEIIDALIEPRDIPVEMGLGEIKLPGVSKNQIKYIIGTLKPLEEIEFQFIVQNNQHKPLRIKYYNTNDEDVIFITKESTARKNDMDKVVNFMELSSVIFIILPLLSQIFTFTLIDRFILEILIKPVISISMLSGFTFFLLPRFRGFVESLIKIISGLSQQLPSVQINGGKNSLVALQNAQITADSLRMGDD